MESVMVSPRIYVREVLQKQEPILCSLWGVFGLDRSENKASILVDLVKSVNEMGNTWEESMEIVFGELEAFYQENKPLLQMRNPLIHDIVVEERTYINQLIGF